MKSLVLVADKVPVPAMLRGDHQLSETKLRVVLGAKDLRPAQAREIGEWFGAGGRSDRWESTRLRIRIASISTASLERGRAAFGQGRPSRAIAPFEVVITPVNYAEPT
jgi:hypothetical protein